jgi:quinol monooxygenase YgiN
MGDIHMNKTLLALGLLAMMAGGTQTASAQDGSVFVVTYIEVQPGAKAEAATLLKGLRESARRDEGNQRADVLESTARPGHFVMLTTWKDQKGLDGHMAAAPTKEARDKLNGLRNSPADDRIHNSLAVAATDVSRRPARAFYVVTHVDVPPPRKDECVTMLKKLADDSRKDQGNVAFDVVQQTSRPNHFTVVEAWKDRKAFGAHVMTPHVRAFRDQLTPMSGALYDERLYRVVN